MNKHRSSLIIGSRGSRLALWQANWVKACLRELRPELDVQIEIIKTTGDVMKNAPLSLIGGKGVFTKELEEELLAGRINLAVHSLKDLPTKLPDDLLLAAICEREDARDALLLAPQIQSSANPSVLNLPQGAVVGTSSLRRLAQLKHRRPDLSVKELRGNVDTRLRKLEDGNYEAIVLAAAGLNRLGLSHRISAFLNTSEMLPAVGQGALGLETRIDDELTRDAVSPLNHPATHAACTAERALLGAFGLGCQVPLAAHAVVVRDSELRLDGLIAGLSGDRIVEAHAEGHAADAAQLGASLAEALRKQGGEALLLQGL
ncbi:MAG: hydroxymethylbilane synthase [Pyrinomonadaceae bacterium]